MHVSGHTKQGFRAWGNHGPGRKKRLVSFIQLLNSQAFHSLEPGVRPRRLHLIISPTPHPKVNDNDRRGV
jgi:hypothetical protein